MIKHLTQNTLISRKIIINLGIFYCFEFPTVLISLRKSMLNDFGGS